MNSGDRAVLVGILSAVVLLVGTSLTGGHTDLMRVAGAVVFDDDELGEGLVSALWLGSGFVLASYRYTAAATAALILFSSFMINALSLDAVDESWAGFGMALSFVVGAVVLFSAWVRVALDAVLARLGRPRDDALGEVPGPLMLCMIMVAPILIRMIPLPLVG